jgi:23S rRNA pseudouridine2605 synthase
MQERIQKIISQCGIASRRRAEDMIQEGLITVNGRVAELGMKADIGKDHIKVSGKLISSPSSRAYLLFNKPAQCITAMNDPEKRMTVMDYLKRVKVRVFPVGRLDYNSEGLLILTNDGELANAVMHPKKKIPKTYQVKINGTLDDKDKLKLETGVRLDDGVTKPARVRIIKNLKANSWISITIHEGKNRQVRRMMDRIGHSAIRLIRTKISSLTLDTLKPGEYRYMTEEEVATLKKELKTGVIDSGTQKVKRQSRKGWAVKSSKTAKKPKRQAGKGPKRQPVEDTARPMDKDFKRKVSPKAVPVKSFKRKASSSASMAGKKRK